MGKYKISTGRELGGAFAEQRPDRFFVLGHLPKETLEFIALGGVPEGYATMEEARAAVESIVESDKRLADMDGLG